MKKLGKLIDKIPAAVLWYLSCTAGGVYILLDSGNWMYVFVIFALYLIGFLWGAGEYNKGAAMANRRHNEAMKAELARWHELTESLKTASSM